MPDQDAMARLNAALEGRYRVERQLGEGGMATVYPSEDLKHRRRVALKVLKPELAAVVGASRFLAEIETTANLQHPHILPLFDVPGGLNIDISPEGSTVALVGQAGDRGGRLQMSGGPASLVVSDLVRLEVGGLAWGPDGSIYFSGSDGGLWHSSPGRAEPERVTTPRSDGEVHVWPDVLPGAGALLFTRQIGSVDQSEIAVASTATGEVRTLFPGAMARYARSGHLLYESGIEGNLSAVPFDPETLETTGPAQTILEGVCLVGDHGTSYFAVSTTGALLYRTEGSRGEVETTPVWVSRDGSEEPLPLNASGRFRDPAISPDGRRIAFERTLPGGRLDIWIYDRDQGGVLRRLTSEGDHLQPFWSPDGTEVGFSSIRLGTMALFSQPWDGSAPARLLRAAAPGRPLFEGVWSPDGRTVVYREEKFPASSDFASAAPIQTAQRTSCSSRHLPREPPRSLLMIVGSPTNPTSPVDSRYTCDPFFVRGEASRFQWTEVRVRCGPRTGPTSPIGSPGGAWWAATVRTEPEFGVTFREQLPLRPGLLRDGGSPHFDVSPDDGRILAIRGSTSESTSQHIVVLNFFEELREAVPR